jgi:hypothetical protein
MRKRIGRFNAFLASYASQNGYFFVDGYDKQSNVLEHLRHRVDLLVLLLSFTSEPGHK